MYEQSLMWNKVNQSKIQEISYQACGSKNNLANPSYMNSRILTAFTLYTKLEMLLVSDNLYISNQKKSFFINFQRMLLRTVY